jgi:hypothetical protein
MDGQSKLDALRARLTGLSDMLGGEEGVAVSLSLPAHHPFRSTGGAAAPARQAAPPRPQHFESTIRTSSTAVLRSANSHARDAPLGGLLQKYRDAEAHWLKVRGWGGKWVLQHALPQPAAVSSGSAVLTPAC